MTCTCIRDDWEHTNLLQYDEEWYGTCTPRIYIHTQLHTWLYTDCGLYYSDFMKSWHHPPDNILYKCKHLTQAQGSCTYRLVLATCMIYSWCCKRGTIYII